MWNKEHGLKSCFVLCPFLLAKGLLGPIARAHSKPRAVNPDPTGQVGRQGKATRPGTSSESQDFCSEAVVLVLTLRPDQW